MYVRADAELVCRADQHAHLAFAYFFKQRRKIVLLVFLNDGDLLFRDASGFEFLSQVVVDVEVASLLRNTRARRIVAENDLRATDVRRFPVLRQDVPGAAVDFARRQVLGRWVDNARIKGKHTPLARDHKHTVFGQCAVGFCDYFRFATSNRLAATEEFLNHLFL